MTLSTTDAAGCRTGAAATVSLPALLVAGFVLGVGTLPMLPFWGDALRLVAVLAIALLIAADPWRRWALVAALILLLAGPLAERHLMALSSAPAYFSSFISFHDGYPLRNISSLELLAASGGIIVTLWLIVRRQSKQQPVRFAAGILLALAAWVVLSASWGSAAIIFGSADEIPRASIPLVLATASSWLVWIIGGLVILACVRSAADQRCVLAALGTAALIVAFVVLLQHAARDYSYVLEFPDLDYMYRVRGTYYYHGAASLFLAIGLFSLIGLASKRPLLRVLAVLTVGLALYLNSTRALSIATCAGILVTIAVLAPAWRRRMGEIAALAILVPLFATSILYTKDEQRVLPEETTRVEALAETNQSRFALATAAVSRVAEEPITGVGPGCQVPLSGYVLGGELCTDSSHILALDLALVNGAPAAFLFILLAAGAAMLRLLRAIRNKDGDLIDAGLLGFCAMYAVASLFFPKERDWTLLIVFMLLALAFVRDQGEHFVPLAIEKYAFLQRARDRGLLAKLAVGMCVAGAIGWSLLTSATYVMPLFDVVRAERTALRVYNEDVVVHTNNPVLAKVGPRLLSILFSENADFKLLIDDADQLPLSGSAWVLWSAAYDSWYPNLRRQRGFDFHRGYGIYPAFITPTEWVWRGSSSPSTALAALGWQRADFSALEVSGARHDCGALEENGYVKLPPHHSCSLVIEMNKDQDRFADAIIALGYTIEVESEYSKRRRLIGLAPRLRDRDAAELRGSLSVRLPFTGRPLERTVSFDGFQGSGAVLVPLGGEAERLDILALAGRSPTLFSLSINVRLGGNLVSPHRTYKQQPDGVLELLPQVADGRISTMWVGGDGSRIVVDAGEGTLPLIAYELVAPHQPNAPAAPTGWTLDGSNDLERWTLLESRAGMSEAGTARLLTPQTDAYRYYRFTFQAPAPNEPFGLTGLRLFPFAPPISLPLEQKVAE